jgi:outer membrane protein OmpA-like peptidoglycan-associated protein
VPAPLRKFSKLLILTILILGVLLLSACVPPKTAYDKAKEQLGIGESKYDAIAIVIGVTANSPLPALDNGTVKLIGDYVYNNKLDKITVVQAEGSSRVLPYPISMKYESTNSDKIANDFTTFLENFSGGLGSLVPAANGADYLEAIKAADLAVKQSGANTTNPANSGVNLDANPQNPLIIVIGSGLSDSGILNFAQGDLLKAEQDAIYAKISPNLKENDLQGDTIIWINAGQTTAPQFPLNTNSVKHVQGIYSKVLASMGAISTSFVTEQPSDGYLPVNNPDGYTVAQTNVPNESVDWSGLTIEFSDQMLGGFVTNSAAFQNPLKAEEALAGLVQKLLQAPQVKVTITGSQMKVPGEERVVNGDVAQMRADAVARTLKEMGVVNEIVTNNIGSSKAIADQIESDKKVVITFN